MSQAGRCDNFIRRVGLKIENAKIQAYFTTNGPDLQFIKYGS